MSLMHDMHNEITHAASRILSAMGHNLGNYETRLNYFSPSESHSNSGLEQPARLWHDLSLRFLLYPPSD